MMGSTMKAIRYDRYGPPDVLELRDVGMPAVGADEVLVRVRAASVNPLDWHFMRGAPYLVRLMAGLSRPKPTASRLGADMAGSVEAVGRNVTEFRPGDEVFGGLEDRGTLAEYITIRQDGAVLTKPASLTFEQAASVPVAAVTALQALRDQGLVRPGQKVLVNGASGGVGTFTVQIAKALGAKVTGVCSTPNVKVAASIGADQVIDYTREDFTQARREYDLLIDIAGNRTLAETRRVLVPKGVLVVVGGPDKGRWIGPYGRSVRMALVSPAVSQRMVSFLAHQGKADLAVLRELLDAGKVTPVIDRTYPLSDVAEAIGYLEQGHARGKVVVSV
jgi:NADPH:quinone reductase-like Zn-dependent oxidoreductase